MNIRKILFENLGFAWIIIVGDSSTMSIKKNGKLKEFFSGAVFPDVIKTSTER